MKDIAIDPIQIGFGDNQIIFYERLISVAEEQEIDKKIAAIADKDSERLEKEFVIYRSALVDAAVAVPKKLAKEKGETIKVDLINGAKTPAAAIEGFFEDRDLVNEKIIRGAYHLFRSKNNPEYVFLSPSA